MTSQEIENEWPDPEPQDVFDWSLSMREIEKKYAPLRPVVVKVVHEVKEKAPRIKPEAGTLLAKFRKKYPYVYGILEETNSDLPRWLIDNLLKLSI